MKELVLDPDDVMYSHEVSLYENYTLLNLEGAILDDTWAEVPPVYVVQTDEFPGKYLIYNGNNRLHIAKLFRKPLSAVLIEGEEDLEFIPDDEFAYWIPAPWQGAYGGEPTADTEYELIVMKIVDSAKYSPDLPPEHPTEITWRTRDKKRLEEILAECS